MSRGGGPDAFIFVIVAYDLPDRIECLCPYQDRVYVGLTDGSLVILEPEFELHEEVGPWSVEQHIKGFAKRPFTQLEPAASVSGLFSLSATGLRLHALPSLELISQVPMTGVPFRFAWNDKTSTLSVAVRRSLIFYKLENGNFLEINTVVIQDTLKIMAWCGNMLCYGTRAKYVFVDPSTGHIADSITVGRGYPSLVPLSGGEILLSKDNLGMYALSDGSLARNVSLTWSHIPIATVLCEPFVVGLMDNFMEVRNISPTARQCVIQMFNDVDRINVASPFLAMDGSIFMASRERRTVCRLTPVPLQQQIDDLIGMKEFQDALQVVELLDEENKTAKEDDIRVSYGIHLFQQQEYNESLMQLMMRSQRTPLLLLRLFPSLLPETRLEGFVLPVSEEYFAEYEEPTGEDYKFAVSCLLPLLLADRNRLISRKRDDMEEDQQAAEVMEVIDEDAAMEASLDLKPRRGMHRLTPSRIESRAKRTKLAELVDTAIMKAMLVCPDSGTLLQFVRNPNEILLEEGERALKPAGRYFELSALYQSHGLHDIGLEVLRLLSLEPDKLEYPPRGAGSDLRGLTGVWAAVQYLSKLTEEDSEVIQRHAGWVLKSDPESALEVFVGAEKPLPPFIVLPILNQHAPQYSAIYLEAMLEKGDASREEHDRILVDIYLKDAIENEKKLGPLHSQAHAAERFDFALMNEKSTRKLISMDAVFESSGETLYDDVAKTKAKPEFATSFTPPTPLESYSRLRELLIESPFILPTAVLDSIPPDVLLELQALLHERKRSYLSALAIYIQRLHDLNLAEQLCDRVYEQEKHSERKLEIAYSFDFSEHTENLYMDMIRIYLAPEGVTSGEVRNLTDDEWRHLSVLLCRKRYRINIEEMFDLAPGNVELGVLLQFIEGALRTLAEQKHNLTVVHSLYASDNLFRKEQLIRCHQRNFMVTYESACCICRKRIGNAVFVAYPNDSLAHIACYTRQNKQPLSVPTARSSTSYRWD